MAYTITNNCISCNRCQSLCPTNAIRVEGERSWIDASLCNNCVGYYSVPQCAAGCPTNRGCVPNLSSFSAPTASADYWESWFNLHNRLVARLKAAKHTRYWEQWFTAYSQKLSEHIQSNKFQTAAVEA